MEIALSKAIMAQGAHESVEPLFSFAKGCLQLGGNKADPNDNDNGQWCGGFVSWCLNESNYKIAPAPIWRRLNSQQFLRLAEEGKFFKVIEEPVVGCIVILTNYKHSEKAEYDAGKKPTSGHVTFLYGVSGDYLICLGGNQGSHLKFSGYNKVTGADHGSFIQEVNCFLIPIDYPEANYNKNLPTITTSEANKKFGINLETKKNENIKNIESTR